MRKYLSDAQHRSEQRPHYSPNMSTEPTNPPPVSARASTRDASMWERPDTRKIKQYNIRWHGGIFSACKATLILCDESIPSADVPAGLRCRRRGCKESRSEERRGGKKMETDVW